MACVLFVDLGMTCGFAVGIPGSRISGEWELKPSRFESWAMRGIHLRRHLEDTLKATGFTHAACEEVRAHAGVDAAHSYGAQLQVFQSFCEEAGIPYESVGVGTLKKFWTGKGNATKPQMISVTLKRCGFMPVSHNEADAVAGWYWLHEKCRKGVVAEAAV